MTEDLDVRYLIESTEGIFCVYGYSVREDELVFTEGDGEIHSIHLANIIKVTRESVSKEDITDSIKEVSLV